MNWVRYCSKESKFLIIRKRRRADALNCTCSGRDALGPLTDISAVLLEVNARKVSSGKIILFDSYIHSRRLNIGTAWSTAQGIALHRLPSTVTGIFNRTLLPISPINFSLSPDTKEESKRIYTIRFIAWNEVWFWLLQDQKYGSEAFTSRNV